MPSRPSSHRTRMIGITTGDAAGIGPEVARAAVDSGALDPDFEYILIGSPVECIPGNPTPETARASWDHLEEAVARAKNGELAAIVTGPVSKAGLYEIGFRFPGQTEFLADRCGTDDFAMTLTGGRLTVTLTSTHLQLRDAIQQLSTSEIVRVGALMADFLYLRLGRPARVAVAGLNPHAGEAGHLGREEIDIVAPAVSALTRTYPAARASFHGPISPDAVFHQAVQGRWDGVLCMYHDQGLIPLKLHAFDEGVNVTLGLNIIRTSPDHGTAFELAGKNQARAGSMIAAVKLAAELARKRKKLGSSTGGGRGE